MKNSVVKTEMEMRKCAFKKFISVCGLKKKSGASIM